jgi:hypothetical protein
LGVSRPQGGPSKKQELADYLVFVANTTSTKPAQSLVDLFAERGAWEETMLDKIGKAHGRKDANAVMKLVGELLHEGPGAQGQAHGT